MNEQIKKKKVFNFYTKKIIKDIMINKRKRYG